MDSVEMFNYEVSAWRSVESLKLPSVLVSLNMIRVRNTVFITGKVDQKNIESKL